MVYSNKFVLSVLVNGHVQQELSNGCVPLPFDAEYVLRFRNKHNRRAVVKFWIDGENISGDGYIIEANSHTDIKRHRDVDKAFKFVSLDSEDAIDHGKNGPNEDKVKGTIEARFYLEKEKPAYVPPKFVPMPYPYPCPYPVPYPRRPYWNDPTRWLNGPTVSLEGIGTGTGNSPISGIGGSMCDSHISHNASNMMSPTQDMNVLERKSFDEPSTTSDMGVLYDSAPLQDGCTVEGNMTGQSFRTVSIDLEDTYTTLRIFLQGKHVDVPKPIQLKKEFRKQSAELTDLEAENERLRQELAKEENRILKEKLEALKKPAKKPTVKRKPTKKA